MPESKPKPSRKSASASGEKKPGLFARLRAALTKSDTDATTSPAGERPVDGFISAGSRLLTGLIVVVVIGSWAFGRGPLERHVASLHTAQPKVVIEWPVIAADLSQNRDSDPARAGHTPTSARLTHRSWVPKNVQAHLESLVRERLTSDPFDQASLVAAAERLDATGWFVKLHAVQRRADRTVHVTGEWRVPAAVVRKDGAQHLVALDGAILELPPYASTPERLFFINNPASPAPRTDLGTIAHGVPWLGNDVQSAIALLKLLHHRPDVARQVAGVDLTEYVRATKLVLVTDKGHRIVWGSPIGDQLPGEVSVERKVARLVQNLKDFGRIDADQPRIEIYTPVVLVDKTAAAIDGAAAAQGGRTDAD